MTSDDPFISTRTVPTETIELVYRDVEPAFLENDTPVLLLHGYRDTRQAWSGQVSALGRRLLIPDLRGHGESGLPADGDWSIEALAEDALAVLDDAGVSRADVIGHSLGGMIACRIAIDTPDRLRAVVFNDTSPLPPDEVRRTTIEEQLAILDQNGLQALAEQTPRWRRAPGESPAALQVAIERVRQSHPETLLGCGLTMLEMEDQSAELAGSAIPALVLYGSEDSSYSRNGAARLLAVLADAREARIEGAGHYPQSTHTDAYNSAVTAFLREVDALG